MTTDQAESDRPADDLELLGLPEARRRIAALLQANQPLPDDLHERGLRLELEVSPFDIDLTAAMISLLYRLGRAPIPEHPGHEASALTEHAASGIEQLLDEAVIHAEAGDLSRDYACLWQSVVRYPHSARGWAEYARRLGDRHEWAHCRLALSRALAFPEPADLETTLSLLNALRSLAFNQRIEGIEWQAWIEQLPKTLKAHPLLADLMLWTGNLDRAATMLPLIVRGERSDADGWIVAANIAYEQEKWADAYRYWRQAFEANLPHTLRSAVVDYSARLTHVLYQTAPTSLPTGLRLSGRAIRASI